MLRIYPLAEVTDMAVDRRSDCVVTRFTGKTCVNSCLISLTGKSYNLHDLEVGQ